VGGLALDQISSEERFLKALTASQGRLQAYLFCLLGDMHDANSVLQEANLVMWRKSSEFDAIQSFNAWSREIAYFQALAFLRDRKRDRLIFSQEVIDNLASERDEVDFDERRLALRNCVAKLHGRWRQLIYQRYSENKRIAQIAAEQQKSEGAVKMSLKRIRQTLMDCVNKRLEAMG
jgi:RNA polymerase sigma-70 factor (ECF subfamily)